MKLSTPNPIALAMDSHLHLAARLAIADPKVIAQALLYEMAHGETETFEALAKLLEANRNEGGKNLSSVVATANHEVNKVENYLFNENDLARQIFEHCSASQIAQLQEYNTARLQNFEPSKEIALIREIYGHPDILKPGEGNSYLRHFLEQGKSFAGEGMLPIPESKPEIKAIRTASMPVCMLSFCLEQGYLPLRRHDGSHVNSGCNGYSTRGEIYNQSHDLSQNSLAQYGVVPNLLEQMRNRKIICSFEGLPETLGKVRDWRRYVNDALETWRLFLLEHPEYVEKWKLTPFVDEHMRMIKPDGSPIISSQTHEQQIPVIDYTDLAVIRHLGKKLDRLLTDDEVYHEMPYADLYWQSLMSIDLLAQEYIMRDGQPFVMVNGMLDTNATYKDASYGDFEGMPELKDLSSNKSALAYEVEALKMQHRRQMLACEEKWCGYLVELGQDQDKRMWVSDKPPALSILYPHALTVHRVTLPKANIDQAKARQVSYTGQMYLVDPEGLQIDSSLSTRDETLIPRLEQRNVRRATVLA